ncbi:MAG: amidase [bacterium]
MRYPTLKSLLVVVIFLALPGLAQDEEISPITTDMLPAAETVIGLEFSPAERETMLADLNEQLASYQAIRALQLANEVPPALLFSPLPTTFTGTESYLREQAPVWSEGPPVTRPDDLDELAFWSVGRLAELVRTRQVTSLELTQLALDRLTRHGPRLECVVTLTTELALEQAARADAEIAAGRYRGPLHGIPYGAKDLFAVPGYPTTWGATPYRDQQLEDTATVAQKLEEAGAVLVAKLTLGALAWGDVWFGGKTLNPWNPQQGSSGSSAGSAASVSAGLVPFALGTETWGSIVSPCTRCGVTGLRPTFGRVSRAGAMALSWSLDKVGAICRTVEDCAVVFEAIRGPDRRDLTVGQYPFPYRSDLDLGSLRCGYLAAAFAEEYPGREYDQATLEVLRGLGLELVPIELPDLPLSDLSFILSAEAAAAFDELTRSGRDDELVRQIRYAWPNVFRTARLIPAVEYIQANRVRFLLIQAMTELMAQVDLYVTPTFGGDNLLLTNLTGHPCVVVPNGFATVEETGTDAEATVQTTLDDRPERNPHSISFTGRLFDEATLLAVARAYQEATEFHRQHPPGF